MDQNGSVVRFRPLMRVGMAHQSVAENNGRTEALLGDLAAKKKWPHDALKRFATDNQLESEAVCGPNHL